MAKSSLRISLTIHMDLSQRITQVGEDPYLLELSELHKIGAHAYPLPRRSTLLLAPSRTDGPNAGKSREKSPSLSLKSGSSPHCTFCSFIWRRKLFPFVLYSFNFPIIPSMSL